jgi:hypothetical protein
MNNDKIYTPATVEEIKSLSNSLCISLREAKIKINNERYREANEMIKKCC